jgi:predicted ATPase
VNQKKIIINTSRSEYPLIDAVAKEVMGWRVSKEEDYTKGDFDLWWTDLGIDGSFLAQLKCY